MQDGQGGYFRVLDQNRTYSELKNSQSALASPVLQSEIGVLGQKLDMINSTLQTNTGNDTQSLINAQSSEEVQQFNTSIQSASTEITNGTTKISTGFEQVAESAQSAAMALRLINASIGQEAELFFPFLLHLLSQAPSNALQSMDSSPSSLAETLSCRFSSFIGKIPFQLLRID